MLFQFRSRKVNLDASVSARDLRLLVLRSV
jgi:hypothetical protein